MYYLLKFVLNSDWNNNRKKERLSVESGEKFPQGIRGRYVWIESTVDRTVACFCGHGWAKQERKGGMVGPGRSGKWSGPRGWPKKGGVGFRSEWPGWCKKKWLHCILQFTITIHFLSNKFFLKTETKQVVS